MWTLDTSIFIRAADVHNPDQVLCQELIDTLDRQQAPIIVPRLVLVEMAGALRRLTHDPIRARLAIDILRSMPNVRLIPLDDDLLDIAADVAADYAVRGADATYVAVARVYQCTLVSLDREQRERAAVIVRTCTPAEALAQLSRS